MRISLTKVDPLVLFTPWTKFPSALTLRWQIKARLFSDLHQSARGKENDKFYICVSNEWRAWSMIHPPKTTFLPNVDGHSLRPPSSNFSDLQSFSHRIAFKTYRNLRKLYATVVPLKFVFVSKNRKWMWQGCSVLPATIANTLTIFNIQPPSFKKLKSMYIQTAENTYDRKR